MGAPAASAAESYCSPETGDLCISARKTKGVRVLRLDTFSLRGKVEICVKAAGEDAVCKTRSLRAGKYELYSASIKWAANYPRTPKGTRKVTFRQGDLQIGPTLTFKAN